MREGGNQTAGELTKLRSVSQFAATVAVGCLVLFPNKDLPGVKLSESDVHVLCRFMGKSVHYSSPLLVGS